MIQHVSDYLQNSKEKSVLLLSFGFVTVWHRIHEFSL